MRYVALIAGILILALALFFGYRFKEMQKAHPYPGMNEGVFYGYENNYLSPPAIMLYILGIALVGFSIYRIIEG